MTYETEKKQNAQLRIFWVAEAKRNRVLCSGQRIITHKSMESILAINPSKAFLPRHSIQHFRGPTVLIREDLFLTSLSLSSLNCNYKWMWIVASLTHRSIDHS
jgi:hypothetical protein